MARRVEKSDIEELDDLVTKLESFVFKADEIEQKPVKEVTMKVLYDAIESLRLEVAQITRTQAEMRKEINTIKRMLC